MPPRDAMLTSRQKPTNIYSVMLILASVFLLFSIVLVWHELDDHYQFMGSEAGGEAPVDEGGEAPLDEVTEPVDAGEAGGAGETTEPPPE